MLPSTPFTYFSVCDGIGAAHVAFTPLGWQCVGMSEIDTNARAVLKYWYPNVPLHGDFTKLISDPPDADALCGGTPCQAFSVAGNRDSLADERGNLTLQFVTLANAIDAIRSAAGKPPILIIWENVPGVLNTSDNAFGCFLGELCGSGAAIPPPKDRSWPNAGVVHGPQRSAAWRVVDAQHFGLAQRRKRVFVLAGLGAGNWACADALLPIIQRSAWHPAPRREAGQGVAGTLDARTSAGGGLGTDFECAGGLKPACTDAVMAHGQANAEIVNDGEPSLTCNHEPPILVRMREGKAGGGKGSLLITDQSLTLATANDQVLAVPSSRAADGDSRGPARGDLVSCAAAHEDALAFQGNASHTNSMNPGPVVPTLDKAKADGMAVAYNIHGTPATSGASETQVHSALRARAPGGSENSTATVIAQPIDPVRYGGSNQDTLHDASGVHSTLPAGTHNNGGSYTKTVDAQMHVRRLTPRECERLQGFPVDYTLVPVRWFLFRHTETPAQFRRRQFRFKYVEKSDPMADGPRYKMLGNSWATPCAHYVGAQVERVRKASKH